MRYTAMTSRALISRRRVRLASRCSPPHTADGSPPADHITRPPAYRLGGTGSARVPGQRDQLRANWIENPRCIAQLEPGGSKSGGHPKGPGDRNLGSARGRENHLWVSTFSQAAGHAPLLTLPSIQLAANCLREAKGVVWVGRSLPILVSFGTQSVGRFSVSPPPSIPRHQRRLRWPMLDVMVDAPVQHHK